MYGKIIKEQRKQKNLTQKELAIILQTTQSNIGKYEREVLDLSTNMLYVSVNFLTLQPTIC